MNARTRAFGLRRRSSDKTFERGDQRLTRLRALQPFELVCADDEDLLLAVNAHVLRSLRLGAANELAESCI